MPRALRFVVRASILAAIATAGLPASAQEDACKEGFEQADILLKPSAAEPKLLEARDKLRICGGPTCKDWMIADCTKRLAEVEARVPTVVFAAKDANGADLVDVTVLQGEATIATKLDGRAHEMNPGARVFTFVLADGSKHEVSAVVREGQKAQRVAWEAPLTPKPPSPPAEGDAPSAPTKTTNPLVYIGFGAGAVGFGVGAVTGIVALSKASTSNCQGVQCTQAGLDDIDSGRTAATISTIGFIVGIIGTGVGVYGLLSPKYERPPEPSRAAITPWVGAGSAGVRGAF